MRYCEARFGQMYMTFFLALFFQNASRSCSFFCQAGGIVTDLEGNALNFSSEAAKGDGSRLSKDVVGIVASSGAGGSSQGGVHAKILAALKDARHQ